MMSHTIKIVTPLVLLLAVIIGTSVYASKNFTSSSKRLENSAVQIEASVNGEDWANANAKLTNIKEDWQKVSKSWAMLLDHNELDNIETALTKMSAYIRTKDKSSALAETAAFKQYVKHIPEKEIFNFKNLL
jgi:hypothetical protein